MKSFDYVKNGKWKVTLAERLETGSKTVHLPPLADTMILDQDYDYDQEFYSGSSYTFKTPSGKKYFFIMGFVSNEASYVSMTHNFTNYIINGKTTTKTSIVYTYGDTYPRYYNQSTPAGGDSSKIYQWRPSGDFKENYLLNTDDSQTYTLHASAPGNWMYYNFIVQYPDTDVFDQEVENPVLYTASMIHTIPSVSNPGYNGYANYDNSARPTVKQTSYDPDYYNIYWDISYNWDTPIQKTKKTFNITYSSNSGGKATGSVTGQTYQIHAETKNLQVNGFTRPGYTFYKWLIQGQSVYHDEGASFTFDVRVGNYNIDAIWNSWEYTITFNANGGTPTTIPNIEDYYSDTTAQMSVDISDISVTKTNSSPSYSFNFLGWSLSSSATSADYTTSFTFWATAPTADETFDLYAIFATYKYTYELDENGGVAGDINEKEYSYIGSYIDVTFGIDGLSLTRLQKPTRENYTFKGWGTATNSVSNKATQRIFFSQPLSNNRTRIYARWELLKYTINYNKNHTDSGGDSAPSDQEITHGTPWYAKSKINRIGYTFAGWWTESSASGGERRWISQSETGVPTTTTAKYKINDGNLVYESDTLYARWTLDTYTITYSPGIYPSATRTGDSSKNFTINDAIVINNKKYISLDGTTYTESNREHIGWTVEYDHVSIPDVIVKHPDMYIFEFKECNVRAISIWNSIQYEIEYKEKYDDTSFYSGFYVPEKQYYTYDEVESLKLKQIYIEYRGFYTDGWTLGPEDNFGPIIIPGKLYTDATKNVARNVTLYPIWQKIEYMLSNNTYNHVSIYSRIDNFSINQNLNRFIPYTKRLNHTIKLKNSGNTADSKEYDPKRGMVLSNIYSIVEYTFDNSHTTINDAYSFFYEDEIEPDVKSLKSLQEIYKKESLNELKNVVVVKHYPSHRDNNIVAKLNSTSAPFNQTNIVNTNDYYYEFNEDGTFEINAEIVCEILLVGGGGGGGNGGSSGGGGGGGSGCVVHIPLYILTPGIYTINVGTGGSGDSGSGNSGGSGGNSEIKRGVDVIFGAMGGGGGGRFNNNGQSGVSGTEGDADGGSGGGAGGSTNSGVKLEGGNEGNDNNSYHNDNKGQRRVSYKNKAGFSSEFYGAGGGGAGTYSNNIEGSSILTNGGNGIYINIKNDNAIYGSGGNGGNVIEGNDGRNESSNGNGGGGGDKNKNGGRGGNGIIIIKVKEGHEFDHGNSHEDVTNTDGTIVFGMMQRKILVKCNGSVYKRDNINLLDTDDKGEDKQFYFYGFYKAESTNEFEFKLSSGLQSKFTIGFVDNTNTLQSKLTLECSGGIGSEVYGTIFLVHNIYYPIYAEYGSGSSFDFILIQRRLFNSGNSFDNIPSTKLFHLNNFPGTTTMKE
jgi:uncharacterized repeat protein (TIGR02543 family)